MKIYKILVNTLCWLLLVAITSTSIANKKDNPKNLNIRHLDNSVYHKNKARIVIFRPKNWLHAVYKVGVVLDFRYYELFRSGDAVVAYVDEGPHSLHAIIYKSRRFDNRSIHFNVKKGETYYIYSQLTDGFLMYKKKNLQRKELKYFNKIIGKIGKTRLGFQHANVGSKEVLQSKQWRKSYKKRYYEARNFYKNKYRYVAYPSSERTILCHNLPKVKVGMPLWKISNLFNEYHHRSVGLCITADPSYRGPTALDFPLTLKSLTLELNKDCKLISIYVLAIICQRK